MIYSASAVKIYSALSSLLRFENKIIFLYFEKNALAYYNAGVIVAGLAPGADPTISATAGFCSSPLNKKYS
jgi:hypothetical protein